MANARGPYYFQLNSHSIYAPHTATVQTGNWTNATSAGGKGQFIDWNGDGQDALAMIEGYVDLLAPFYPTTYIFDNWTIFNQPFDPGPSFPRTSGVLTGKVGTDATPGWDKATQATLWWKTTGFGDMKIALLDFGSNDDFNKASTLTPGRLTDLNDYITDMAWAFAGRDNNRPATFKSSTVKLNDELRKQYRMA
jgi:hypothetical protein